MRLKWYGAATVLLEHDGSRLLFDPFLLRNDAMVKPPIDELSAVDTILVTHGHFDHIADTPAILAKGGGKARVYCTAQPRKALMAMGVEEGLIHQVSPGDSFTIGSFAVRVRKGKHIVFDGLLVMRKLFSLNVIRYWGNLIKIFREHRKCPESGETVAFDICVNDKRILLLGSLNLDDGTDYPKGADLLITPFQGRSDIQRYAMSIIDRLLPKKVLLTHFDDAYPPISSTVKTDCFLSRMTQKHPNTPVICPHPGTAWIEIEW